MSGHDLNVGAAVFRRVRYGDRSPAGSVQHSGRQNPCEGVRHRPITELDFKAAWQLAGLLFPCPRRGHVWPTSASIPVARGFSRPPRVGCMSARQRLDFKAPHNEKNRPQRSGNSRFAWVLPVFESLVAGVAALVDERAHRGDVSRSVHDGQLRLC